MHMPSLHDSSLFIIPCVIAFQLLLFKFYVMDRGNKPNSVPFYLACVAAFVPLIYMVLWIGHFQIPYLAAGLGVIGTTLLVSAVVLIIRR